MAEENQSDQEQQIEEEMMRMMEEEIGDGAQDDAGETGGNDAGLEAEMLQAMQEGQEAGETEGGEAGLEAEMLQAMMDETSASTPEEAQDVLQRAQTMLPGQELSSHNIGRLLDVKLTVTIELGRTHVPISNLLEWSEGSLIELDKVSGEAVEVLINTKSFARGEVVTIAENFGVRLVEILPASPRG